MPKPKQQQQKTKSFFSIFFFYLHLIRHLPRGDRRNIHPANGKWFKPTAIILTMHSVVPRGEQWFWTFFGVLFGSSFRFSRLCTSHAGARSIHPRLFNLFINNIIANNWWVVAGCQSGSSSFSFYIIITEDEQELMQTISSEVTSYKCLNAAPDGSSVSIR